MTAADLLRADISDGALARFAIVTLVASISRGFAGFGAALIYMPLATTIVAPRTAAAVLVIVDFILAAPLIPNAWRLGKRRPVGVMALGALIGVPVGTFALTRLDPIVTRWIISGLVFSLLVLLISGWRYRGSTHPAVAACVGCVSGLFNGLAQTGGPPVVAYWLGQHLTGAIARANIVLFFAISGVFSVISYLLGGLFTPDVLKLSAIAGPVYGLGLFVGARMFALASETMFRRVCYLLIATAATIGLPLLDRFTH